MKIPSKLNSPNPREMMKTINELIDVVKAMRAVHSTGTLVTETPQGTSVRARVPSGGGGGTSVPVWG